jgi:hypothetical protein
MTEEQGDSELDKSTDPYFIDEAMLEMSEFISQMSEVEGYLYDVEMETGLQLENVSMSMPLQLDLLVNEDGSVVLGGSPPLYYAETTILPVFHQLNIKICVNENSERDGGNNE